MPGIASAESTRRKKEPKVLEHMKIEPRLGGGHIVTHHFKGYQHEPEPHEFEEHEGHKAMLHIAKHAGLPHPDLEEQGGSEPEPYDEG